jgi:acyl dehydratase
MSGEAILVGGPWYDDLSVGDVFDSAPGVTLTGGLAAAHRGILGGRLHLASDAELSRQVAAVALAPPALVWDTSIGQSTLVTGRAIANLFYRGLIFRRHPAIGDTLKTTTRIVGLRPSAPRPGRSPRGLVVMQIVTTDQDGAVVLDYHRCALLPPREGVALKTGGLMEPPLPPLDGASLAPAIGTWNLAAFRAGVPGPHFASVKSGASYRVEAGDVVSSAPELARLTLNLAAVHHDSAATPDGERLVYGGHTIGLAAAQVTRALPCLVTFLGWESCDHTGPVHEGDTLNSEITIEKCEALSQGGLVHLRVQAHARPARSDKRTPVLDWRLVGLMA